MKIFARQQYKSIISSKLFSPKLYTRWFATLNSFALDPSCPWLHMPRIWPSGLCWISRVLAKKSRGRCDALLFKTMPQARCNCYDIGSEKKRWFLAIRQVFLWCPRWRSLKNALFRTYQCPSDLTYLQWIHNLWIHSVHCNANTGLINPPPPHQVGK